jgi:hypothetical protein
MAIVAKHPVLFRCIQLLVERVDKCEYGNTPLYSTGPQCLGDALNDILYRPHGTSFANNDRGHTCTNIHFLKYATDDNDPDPFTTKEINFFDTTLSSPVTTLGTLGTLGTSGIGKKVVQVRYKDIDTERNLFQNGDREHYSVKWGNRRAFK